MYLSEKITMVEFFKTENCTLIRAHVKRSVIREYCYPYVAISSENGNIEISQCSCENDAPGQCSHVSCLLYGLVDLFFKEKPLIMDRTPTEKPCKWGQGTFNKSGPPEAIGSTDYKKKIKPDKYIDFDPRPPEMRQTSKEERNK